MLRELLQMSQTEFARKISISQGALSQIESGRSRLSMETLKNLSSEFNVNCNWIVNGKGDIFYSRSKSKGFHIKNNLIPLVSKDARASYLRGFSNPEYIKTLDEYHIPGYENDNYRMFELQGDGMNPTLYSSEIAITRKISNYKSIEDNSLVVCVFRKDLIPRRFEKIPGNESEFLAKCDNPDYDNLKLKYRDLNEVWLIEGKITNNFLKSGYDLFRIISIEKNLKDLNHKLEKYINHK